MGLTTLTRRLLGRPSLKERRQYPRRRDPVLHLVIEGKRYPAIDWSLGGFLIRDFHRKIDVRENVSGKIRGRSGIAAGEFSATAVRKTDAGEVGFRFLEISSKTWMSMSAIPPP